ncbi:hypothetical protein F385_405 [Pantoea agglomerans 299R]|nr:hypothetical protein F385_405 [Pantoea agglomerans 299R]
MSCTGRSCSLIYAILTDSVYLAREILLKKSLWAANAAHRLGSRISKDY